MEKIIIILLYCCVVALYHMLMNNNSALLVTHGLLRLPVLLYQLILWVKGKSKYTTREMAVYPILSGLYLPEIRYIYSKLKNFEEIGK